MKYFTVPLLLALLIVALCAKAALGEDTATCNTTCQCFSPGQPLPFATTHTPQSLPEKASTVQLSSTFDIQRTFQGEPLIWALTFPYFYKWRMEDAMVRESMYDSLPYIKNNYKLEYYTKGDTWGYGGYITESTWSQFIIAPKNKGFYLERTAEYGPTISLACVTYRGRGTTDYQTYTFPKRKGDGFFPDVRNGEEMSMCVWAAYEERHPLKCSVDCGTNVECRYRTVKSIGAIVWAVDIGYLKSNWLTDAQNFIYAFRDGGEWRNEDKADMAHIYYRRAKDVIKAGQK